AVTIRPLDNDSGDDGDILNLTRVVGTSEPAVIVGGTNVVFTPATNFNGTATIGYSISDGNGGTASALITVTVSPANDPPVAVDEDRKSAVEGQGAVRRQDNDSDGDGESLTS